MYQSIAKFKDFIEVLIGYVSWTLKLNCDIVVEDYEVLDLLQLLL